MKKRKRRVLIAALATASLCLLLVTASAAQAGRPPQLGHSQARTTFQQSTGHCRARRPPQPRSPATRPRTPSTETLLPSWCTDSYPDTLTVDLGQVRNLDGIGITLDNASSSAKRHDLAGHRAGDWHTCRRHTTSPSTLATPMYVPSGLAQVMAHREARARGTPRSRCGIAAQPRLHRGVPAVRFLTRLRPA